MAVSGLDKLSREFNERFDIEYRRLGMLDGMPDGEIKSWISELIAEKKQLKLEIQELSRAAGCSAFNPRGAS